MMDLFKVVLLLQFFFVCESVVLFLISFSFGASGWLCFVIVAFLVYLNLYIFINIVSQVENLPL